MRYSENKLLIELFHNKQQPIVQRKYMLVAVLRENSDFSKLRRLNYKSVSEFNVLTILKPNTNSSF